MAQLAHLNFFPHQLIFDYKVDFTHIRRVCPGFVELAHVPAQEGNKHVVREAGAASGKHSLKLNVYRG